MAVTINVIVIGAGFGGLSAAIELARKGCKVKVLELTKTIEEKGDVINLASSATRVLRKWGPTLANVVAEAGQPRIRSFLDQHGTVLYEQPLALEYDGYPNLYCNRNRTQKSMYDYAVSIGIEFVFGARISEYFETEMSAGILLNGNKFEADFVVVADGVHSKGREFVTNGPDRAQNSGFAVYRSCFDSQRLLGNPKTEWLVKAGKDLTLCWIGSNTHAVFAINSKINSAAAFVTHKDNSKLEESWSLPGKIEDMLAAVEGWDETLIGIIKQVPPEVLIDWKLLWRNPVKPWVSKGGRIVLVGDAAHPHLATSGTGGTQAIEDGATLGAVIDCAGKSNIPLALKAFETLRFERTALTQRMGWESRHRWHQTDWELVKTKPDYLKHPEPAWLYISDPEQYAYENFAAVKSHLETGTPFKSTNIPGDHVHSDWTIEDMMAREGQKGGEDFYIVKQS